MFKLVISYVPPSKVRGDRLVSVQTPLMSAFVSALVSASA